MKKTKLLAPIALILAFLMMLSSVGVFAEETNETMEQRVITLRDNIAQVVKDVEDGWSAVDMVAYSGIPDRVCEMSDATKQAIISAYTEEAAGERVTVSDRARIEIVLKALGVDSTQIYPEGENAPINNAQLLCDADHTASGHYTAPWILLANLQGKLNLSQEQTDNLISVLSSNAGDGTFGYEWGGVFYPDPDTAGVALAALAPIRETNDAANTLIETILSGLGTTVGENGSFGSANSDAMIIIGLIALGENPYEFCNTTTGVSVVEGLLSYANEANNGFTFYDAENYMATEQGFRALVALSLYGGEPYNIYDFRDVEENPSDQQEPQDTPPVVPEPEPEIETINVYMTIKTDSELWIDKLKTTIPVGGTVYDAFVTAIENTSDMQATGADEGYIRSIAKGDVILSERGSGENSGWLYKVNELKPTVGLKDYVLAENDEVVWYYVSDWNTDVPDILGGGGNHIGGSGGGITGGMSGGSGGVTSKPAENKESNEDVTSEEITKEPQNEEIIKEEIAEKEEEEITVPEFSDTKDHWASDAIDYVLAHGIMNGVGDDRFAPEEKLTRGMLVTMLYRLGKQEYTGENHFTDVPENVWYYNGANWAYESGIASGFGDGAFLADGVLSREQLVVMLFRYTKHKGYDTNAKAYDFTDNYKISDWATEAVLWAKENGIVMGRDDGSFAPGDGVTRAEIAMVFMRFCENILRVGIV